MRLNLGSLVTYIVSQRYQKIVQPATYLKGEAGQGSSFQKMHMRLIWLYVLKNCAADLCS